MSFKDDANALRHMIEGIKSEVKAMRDHDVFTQAFTVAQAEATGEMKANITLAFRHLEDARMRLGKAIQAYDGGVSCYDKVE